VVHTLRAELSAVDAERGLELLLDRIASTQTNIELLMQVQRTSAARGD
jgi:transcription termination factor Rho